MAPCRRCRGRACPACCANGEPGFVGLSRRHADSGSVYQIHVAAPMLGTDLPLLCLHNVPCRLYRMPNLACAAASARRTSTRQAKGMLLSPPSSLPFGRCTCLRAPPIPTLGAGASRRSTICSLLCSVDLSSTFYALNPSGDLVDTQSAFQDWFSGMRGWQVGFLLPLACLQAVVPCAGCTARTICSCLPTTYALDCIC